MRIVHVVPSYFPATRYGGPIYSVHGLCRGLVENGHEVDVFTTSVDGPGDSDVPHERPVDLDGVRVWYFRSPWLRRLYFAPRMRGALARALRSADVAHLHSVYLWPTNMAARLAVRQGVPYVLAPRGMLVADLVRLKSRWAKTAWLALVERYTLKHASRMHYTSRLERDLASRLHPGLPPSCIVCNGVETPVADERSSDNLSRRDTEAPYCLFLGRINWKKGLDRLLRAVAGTDIRLVICGNDEEGYARDLLQLAGSLGIAHQVELPGPAYAGDKWRLLREARILVLPSLNENFGNVIPEAMAVGCPVVTTTGVGAADLVLEAGAGVVCEPEVESLRAALVKVWQDAGARQAMSRGGQVFAKERLSWTRIARDMVDCYRAASQGS